MKYLCVVHSKGIHDEIYCYVYVVRLNGTCALLTPGFGHQATTGVSRLVRHIRLIFATVPGTVKVLFLLVRYKY